MLNKVILIGNLGADPELKQLDGGTSIANFSIATSESYKNKQGEKVTNSEWHKCVCYGKSAEIIDQYTSKGDKLYIEGSIHTRSWDDNEGNKKYITEVKVRDFKFLSTKGTQGSSSAPEVPQDEDDDLPF